MQKEFHGAKLLRLAPYSATPNAIEIIWSTWKAEMKIELAQSLQLLNQLPDISLSIREQSEIP